MDLNFHNEDNFFSFPNDIFENKCFIYPDLEGIDSSSADAQTEKDSEEDSDSFIKVNLISCDDHTDYRNVRKGCNCNFHHGLHTC